MEATSISETFMKIYHITRLHIPEDNYLYSHGREKLNKCRGAVQPSKLISVLPGTSIICVTTATWNIAYLHTSRKHKFKVIILYNGNGLGQFSSKSLNPNLNQFNSVHNLTAYPSGSRLFNSYFSPWIPCFYEDSACHSKCFY